MPTSATVEATRADVAPTRSTTRRARPRGGPPLSFPVDAGTANEYLKVNGDGGTPSLSVIGPDGAAVAVTTKANAASTGDYVTIPQPVPGMYTLVPDDGSVPIASFQVAKGYALPQVEASVATTEGASIAHLHAVGLQPGLQVALSEKLPTGVLLPIGTTTQADADLPFTPAPGPACVRDLVASVVLPSGAMGTSLPAGQYDAPAPAKPTVGAHHVVLPAIPARARVKITVTPYAPLAGAGPPRSLTFRPGKPRHHKHHRR